MKKQTKVLLLSLIYPGLGDLYNRNVLRALLK